MTFAKALSIRVVSIERKEGLCGDFSIRLIIEGLIFFNIVAINLRVLFVEGVKELVQRKPSCLTDLFIIET